MKFLGSRPQHEDLKLLVEDPDAVEGNLAKFDANGNPVDSGLSTPNVSDAVSKKHTQGTDTTLGTMTADINMNSHKIINVTDPTLAQDAATKNYVDTHGIALDQVVLGSQIFG